MQPQWLRPNQQEASNGKGKGQAELVSGKARGFANWEVLLAVHDVRKAPLAVKSMLILGVVWAPALTAGDGGRAGRPCRPHRPNRQDVPATRLYPHPSHSSSSSLSLSLSFSCTEYFFVLFFCALV